MPSIHWPVCFELAPRQGPLYLLEILECRGQGPSATVQLRARAEQQLPDGLWRTREWHRLCPDATAEEFFGRTVESQTSDGTVVFYKEMKFEGCRVDFAPASSFPWAACAGPEFDCAGCGRRLVEENLFFDQSEVRLCRACWAMGLMDIWEGSLNRCAGWGDVCSRDAPWRPSSQPLFVHHPEARLVSARTDHYDTTMKVFVCEICGHAWLTGAMK
ncbi:MAG: hypothetical protein U0931_25480 [Vulcanimicrobiota bacterium]